jgi:hypothetical protein
MASMPASAQEKNKRWKVTLLANPNVSIVDPYYVLKARPLFNAGTSVHVRKEHTSKKYFFSYALSVDRNATKIKGLPDNRNAVNNQGLLIGDSRYFDAVFAYTYLAPAFNFNYKVSQRKGVLLGVSTGMAFKYFVRYTTSYQLYDGERKSILKDADIEANYVGNSPSANFALWYEFALQDRWAIHSKIDYTYDLNFWSGVPRYHKVSTSLGLTRTITPARPKPLSSD